AVYNYSLASTLNPGLPEQEQTANLLLDYAPGDLRVFRARGLMSDPIAVSRSRIAAFWSFIKEGIRHILEGLDHVLFVLCLVAGATGLVGLLWRITGFTMGHSITLSLGFFGFVPKGDWFIPTIEWLIALTIIYAAALVFRKPDKAGTDGRRVFLVTSFIGLIHGLGFSFVLHHILKVTSPNIWQSLLAFNVGIEIGQLAIVLAASVVIWLATRVGQTVGSRLRQVIALACGVMAFYWVIERSLPLIGVA
ncbi:MAG: HupE/UreJ family protein, partial [Halioglobus sp.]